MTASNTIAVAQDRRDPAAGGDVLTLRLCRATPRPILALGAELKGAWCVVRADEARLSAAFGPLTEPATYRAFAAAVQRVLAAEADRPAVIAHDLHPHYLTTRLARTLGLPTIAVQHHHAHIVSVMAEAGINEPVIGVACDGVGHGPDGAAWGCEVLRCEPGAFERIGHLRYFPLIGGDAAALDTWRPAAALLADLPADLPAERGREAMRGLLDELSPGDAALLRQMLRTANRAPRTSSLGRVFDAASFVLGLCRRNRSEAEAAVALEAAAIDGDVEPLPFEFAPGNGGFEFSFAATIAALSAERRAGSPTGLSAARFHETLARGLTHAAVRAAQKYDIETIALSGGCFANRRLRERMIGLLDRRGFRVLTHARVSCGDAGVALGQAVAAANMLEG